MSDIKYCYITEKYYSDNPRLQKILDVDDETKHTVRTHLCLNILWNNNNILIPLRKNLGDAIRKFGKIGFAVPSKSKPKAGLDYRYIMMINNEQYLKFDAPRIPLSQTRIIEDNIHVIEKEALEYIRSYIRVADKGRVNLTSRFKESSLINFHNVLNVKETGK